jgi:Flp pilus assembly protein TadG
VSRPQGDRGSALVEFCVLAVLLLVPVVYLMVTLGRLQAASFATQGAAREAGRAFVTAQDDASARDRADAAALIAFADQGFDDPSTIRVEVECAGDPCLRPDARVVVHATLQVVLPAVPRLVDRFVPSRIEVDAQHVATVDRFRAATSGP